MANPLSAATAHPRNAHCSAAVPAAAAWHSAKAANVRPKPRRLALARVRRVEPQPLAPAGKGKLRLLPSALVGLSYGVIAAIQLPLTHA